MASDPKGLGAKFDAHTNAEFNTRDMDATMATMGDAPHVTHVPTMTGGSGYDAVRHFCENYFVGRVPADWSVKLISRTVGESQLVDGVLISFTDDFDMPAILPGVKPTGRKVVIRSSWWSASTRTRSSSASIGTRRACWPSSA